VSITPDISPEEIQEFQAEDPDLGPLVEWLTEGQTPSTDVLRQQSLETRNLCSQVPAVHLFDGTLVRKLFDKDSAQLIVPHRLRKTFFNQTHSCPLAAHLGAQITFLQLRSAYYWPGLKQDVIRWCRECEVCAQCKGPPTRRQGRLHKKITGAPLDIVAVDVLSGLPVTPDGKKYVLVLTDYFTKWACAFALSDTEASTCMRAMYDGFCAEFGLPRQLHSNMGKNFESMLFYELCLLAGINKSHTTAFHPQSDGQTERMNRTLLQMLKTTADDNPATGPQRLPTVITAYRMTVHKTTGMTPNMAMLGREVMLPAALIARPLRSHTALLCLSFTTSEMPCGMSISVCEMPPGRRPGRRRYTTMIGQDKLSSPKASLCGCFGRGNRCVKSSVNFNVCGLVRGVLSFSSHLW